MSFTSLVITSSIAELLGVQTRMRLPVWQSTFTIPLIVWVLPVPGYKGDQHKNMVVNLRVPIAAWWSLRAYSKLWKWLKSDLCWTGRHRLSGLRWRHKFPARHKESTYHETCIHRGKWPWILGQWTQDCRIYKRSTCTWWIWDSWRSIQFLSYSRES